MTGKEEGAAWPMPNNYPPVAFVASDNQVAVETIEFAYTTMTRSVIKDIRRNE